MKLDVDIDRFTYAGKGDFVLADYPQALDTTLYADKADYRARILESQRRLDEQQSKMYAHDRYAMLIIFQAMDAAGKDGTIKHVMNGVNPHGIKVYAFKKPSAREIDHGFLWRTNQAMPERGRIAVFNRSYYEEVLVARVHPGIIKGGQRLPAEQMEDMSRLWRQRYDAIRNLEKYLHHNGTRVLKFFLNVSKHEQRRRFLERIDEPDKNWKFSEADVAERQHWDSYMGAYQKCIDKTATRRAPWYVVPADDKKNMRLIVSKIILSRMKKLDIGYPEVSDERRAQLQSYREQLQAE